jgi:hypothetical protein
MKKKSAKWASKAAAANDNPEWTCDDLARAVPMSGLPADLQRILRKRGRQRAPR